MVKATAVVSGRRFNPKRLRALRQRLDLSLRQFARTVDRTAALIGQLEAGRARPSLETLERIARAHNIDLKELFE